MFYTYVLYSLEYNKTYVGYTSNFEGRLQVYNHPQNKGWTRKFQPWKNIYSKEFQEYRIQMYFLKILEK